MACRSARCPNGMRKRRSGPEGLGETEVRPLDQRRPADVLEAEERAELGVQAGVGEPVRRDLVAQEVVEDALCVQDGVECRHRNSIQCGDTTDRIARRCGLGSHRACVQVCGHWLRLAGWVAFVRQRFAEETNPNGAAE